MILDEIAKAAATFSLDPDECRILAAACRVAGAYAMDHSAPVIDPLAALVGPANHHALYLLGALLEAYAAMFEAAGMAAFVEENTIKRPETLVKYALSEIRKDGTGYRFPFPEIGGDDAV